MERALNLAGLGAFERDLTTGDVRWDDRACLMAGVDPAEFDGRAETFFAALHPEDEPGVRTVVDEAVERGGGYQVEYRMVHPDGSVRVVYERGSVEVGADGTPLRVIGIMRDRTPSTGTDPALIPSMGVQAAHNAFLLTFTRALSRASTIRDLVDVLDTLVRPALGAENLFLQVVRDGEEAGGQWENVRWAGVNADHFHRLRDTASEAALRALADERPLFLPEVVAPAGTGPDGEPVEPIRRAWAILPLIVSDRPVGACVIGYPGPRFFNESERALCTTLTGIIAQAAERARMHDLEHQQAVDLQRMMLPRRIPPIPGLETAARYLPGTRGLEVGGDWYDVIEQPDGRIGLAVGDVQGHSAEASAVMGAMRVGLRAYAREGLPPGKVLSRTGRLLSDLQTELLVTCCYLVLDPADGTVTGVRAGHPMPARLAPDGTVSELEVPGGPPLGIDQGFEFPVIRTAVRPGESLLLYTDGLVERRGEDIDVSVRRMLERVGSWVAGRRGREVALEELADHLIAPRAERTGRFEDDVALLLVKRLA